MYYLHLHESPSFLKLSITGSESISSRITIAYNHFDTEIATRRQMKSSRHTILERRPPGF